MNLRLLYFIVLAIGILSCISKAFADFMFAVILFCVAYGTYGAWQLHKMDQEKRGYKSPNNKSKDKNKFYLILAIVVIFYMVLFKVI